MRLLELAALLAAAYAVAAIVATIALLAAASAGGGDGRTNDPAIDLGRYPPAERRRFPGDVSPGRRRPGRFPAYGTEEFFRRCNWTSTAGSARVEPDCAFLVRPDPSGGEGLAWWASEAVRAYLLARQADCRLLIDYGPGVDVGRVLAPHPPDLGGGGRDGYLHDWSVPRGFECVARERCYHTGTVNLFRQSIPGRPPLSPVPFYRFTHGSSGTWLFRNDFAGLKRSLPGFDTESGMACTLGRLFQLAPGASEFEPRLFTEILPALNDEDALVISIYIRTGMAESSGDATEDAASKHREAAAPSLYCAKSLEEKYLTGRTGLDVDFSRIVWMVVTDSRNLKRWIVGEHDGRDANARLPAVERRWKSRIVRRRVVVTGSRGAHTRAAGDPSTAEFAEALIDWYLIGESDVVVPHQKWSYGLTGAMRTSRPISKCNNGVPVS